MEILLLATATAASLPAAPPAQAHEASWEPHPTGVDVRLRAVSAVNSHVAWASGKGTVLRTTDGGASWRAVTPPDAADLDFRDVEAFDAWHAVALTAGPADTSRLYRTWRRRPVVAAGAGGELPARAARRVRVRRQRPVRDHGRAAGRVDRHRRRRDRPRPALG